jgi:hypothetical protein
MTLLDLIDAPPLSLTAQLAAYFKARPGQWIDGRELAAHFGYAGWRTRISNCRQQYGMAIENHVTVEGRFKVSRYRYVPQEADSWVKG